MFIFRQIDRANFAVRGPCSLMHCLRPKNFINQLTTADPIATPAAVDAMLAIRLGCWGCMGAAMGGGGGGAARAGGLK